CTFLRRFLLRRERISCDHLDCIPQQIQIRFEIPALHLDSEVTKEQLRNVQRCSRTSQIPRYSCNPAIVDPESALDFRLGREQLEGFLNAPNRSREIGLSL